jgi:uncharacterized small protein (DUF1192 family)
MARKRTKTNATPDPEHLQRLRETMLRLLKVSKRELEEKIAAVQKEKQRRKTPKRTSA